MNLRDRTNADIAFTIITLVLSLGIVFSCFFVPLLTRTTEAGLISYNGFHVMYGSSVTWPNLPLFKSADFDWSFVSLLPWVIVLCTFGTMANSRFINFISALGYLAVGVMWFLIILICKPAADAGFTADSLSIALGTYILAGTSILCGIVHLLCVIFLRGNN